MNSKILAIIFYLVSFISFLTCILFFVKGQLGMGYLYMALGSSNLCLGAVWTKRSKEDKK
ncbi:MAG: hypothetical protein Q4C49_12545 [Bacillota bacterium]|nr:hypothetical protein [Bacillota bacterium]